MNNDIIIGIAAIIVASLIGYLYEIKHTKGRDDFWK